MLNRAIIQGVNQHYYSHIEELSRNLAKGYANSLAKSIVADERINSLLVDKLLLASELAGRYGDVENREDLSLLAHTLRVDEINIFDEEGKLLFTTMMSVDDWQAYVGHPIYDFIQSDDHALVEDIRENVVTRVQYKYGYFKLDSGRIIQIGIQADAIASLLMDMDVSTSLQQMASDNNIEVATLFDNQDNIIATTNQDYAGFYIDDNEALSMLGYNSSIGHVAHNDDSLYELFIPVIVDNERVGTLALSHDLNAEQDEILMLIIIGFVSLIIVALLIIYVILSNHDKNKQLAKVAYFDPLTGLPNTEYLKMIYKKLRINKHEKNALMLINVSEFKAINMAYGYEMGNIVLIEIANRLRRFVVNENKLVRLTNDRFVLLIQNYSNDNHLKQIAADVCDKFSEAFKIEDIKRYLHATIGVVKIEDKSQSLMDIIQKASMAIEKDNLTDTCSYSLYDSKIAELIKREELIAIELQEVIEGIEDYRLKLQYQPQIDIDTDTIHAVEALARFTSKLYGEISPTEFIAIAEKNHLIYDLGQLIMRKACRFNTILNKQSDTVIKMAINVSGIQLLHDEFIDDVRLIIKECSINPQHFEIELTESVVMLDVDNTLDVINKLHSLGITVSLDDFGTGHSSFYRLSEFNVDTLKIDRSFVNQITIKPNEKLITKEIIQMAHKYDIKVVAEGVENIEEYNYLKDHQCDLVQGYYFSKPLDEEDIIDFIKNIKK